MTQSSAQKLALFLQVTYLYFLQGIPYGFQVKYLPLVLRKQGQQLHVISFLNLVSLPWILKFSWAHLFDVHGGNGKTWIFGCLSALSVTSAVLHYTTDALWMLVPCLLLLSFLSASLDIAVDSLAIRHFDSKDLGYCNIGHIVGYKIGILFGGGALLTFHQEVGLMLFTLALSLIYGVSAIFITLYATSIFTEDAAKPKDVKASKGNQDTNNLDRWSLFKHLLSPDQSWLVVYIFMYKMGEQGFVSMYPLLLVDKGLSMSHIGVITGVFGQICSMAGSTVGGILISKFHLSMRDLLFGTASLRFLLIVMYSVFLLNSSIAFLPHIIIDCAFQLLAGMMTTLTFTTMMQTSKMLPSSIHALHFTLLAAFEVLGKLTLKSLAGTITNGLGFANFFLLACSLDGFIVFLTFFKCKAKFLQDNAKLE